MRATRKAKSYKREPLPRTALVFMVIILIAAVVVLLSGIPQLAKFAASGEITTVTEVTPPFPLNAWDKTPETWGSCDTTNGAVDAVRQFCQCKGYDDVDSCYYDYAGSLGPRYEWTPGSEPVCMNQGLARGYSLSVLKIKCVSQAAGEDTVAPSIITDLATTNPTANSITLTWTASGDDNAAGTASQYDIRHSTSTITTSNWDSATQVTGEPSPKSAGSSESFMVPGLSLGTKYYFAIKTADEIPNWSALSNVASGTTSTPQATCRLDTATKSGIGKFTSQIEVQYNNLDSAPNTVTVACGPAGVSATASECDEITGICIVPASCEYPEVSAATTYTATASIGTIDCTSVTITDNPPGVTTGTLTGAVTNSTGTAIAGAFVNCSGIVSGPADSTGTYGLALAQGTYSCYAVKSGYYPSGTVTLEIASGDTKTQNFVLSIAPVCGNGVIEAHEVCDGTNLGGKNCTDLGKGYTGGTLKCSANCASFDESGCTGAPQCTGTLNLAFEPSPATKGHQATAKVSGLLNCSNKEVTFNCTPSSEKLPALAIRPSTYSGSAGCNQTFTAPSKAGSYSCIANVSGNLSSPATLSVADCVRQNPILTVEPEVQKGGKGDSLLYIVTVGNNNTCDTTYTLNVTSCLDKWSCDLYDTTLPDLDVAEGEDASASLVITSPATGVSVGSTYTHSLAANDLADTKYSNEAYADYTVATCGRESPTLKASKANQSGEPGQERTYAVTIKNLDKCSTYYILNLSCATGWACELSTPDIYLLDGESGNFTVKLTPGASAPVGNYNFTVMAENWHAENKTTNATIVYSVKAADVDQPVPDQMFGHFKVGDDNCDTILGENISNSPKDCAPPPADEPAVCGNDIVEAGEDCDGISDATCPNLCNADCTCPFIIGDDICDTAAGESSAISIDCQKKASSASLIMILVGILGAVGAAGYYFMRRRGMLGGLAATHGVETATPGVNLDTAVNSMLSEGYNPEEIHSSLEAGGWSHGKIESAMASAQTDQEALGKLAEQQGVAAPVEKARAAKYVKKCLAEGYDPTQIRTALISGGWPADAVDGVISKQTAKHIQSHAEKAGVDKPSDDVHALKEYVRKEMNEGHTKQDIKKVLEKAGWSDSDIKSAFGK